MRCATGFLVGIVLLAGLLLGPRLAAAVDSCTVSGTYYMSGFALGDTEVLGLATFTPNGVCTGGTFTSSITIKLDGSPAQTIAPSGTYVVNGDTTMTLTAPGLLTLSGFVSQLVGNAANAVHAVGDVGGAINVGLTMTRTALIGVSGSVAAGSVTLTGDLHLPATTSAAAGLLTLGGAPFLHAFGTNNTFLGAGAGNFTMTGGSNTATGWSALQNNTTGHSNIAIGLNALGNNTTGHSNTATGTGALADNTTGASNTATGFVALQNNTTGASNTATGVDALQNNTTGGSNTATGRNALTNNTTGAFNTATGTGALQGNTTGSANIAVGAGAGSILTTGDGNIDIGHVGAPAEANTIRIGTPGNQTRTFIAGIRGVTTGVANALLVLIDSNGQLGTASSSRRVKRDILDMAEASAPLLQLRPVSFRYTAQTDGPRQYGLIAEEVAEVLPDLVVYDPAGQPETVRYHELAPMLLNELQRQHRELQDQLRTIQAQQETIQEQHQTLQGLQARIEQLERLLLLQAAR